MEVLLVATLSSLEPLQGDMHMCYHLAVYGASILWCIYYHHNYSHNLAYETLLNQEEAAQLKRCCSPS